jgi:hypothetical protein
MPVDASAVASPQDDVPHCHTRHCQFPASRPSSPQVQVPPRVPTSRSSEIRTAPHCTDLAAATEAPCAPKWRIQGLPDNPIGRGKGRPRRHHDSRKPGRAPAKARILARRFAKRGAAHSPAVSARPRVSAPVSGFGFSTFRLAPPPHLTSDCPVIASGLASPIIPSRVGITSARRPSRRRADEGTSGLPLAAACRRGSTRMHSTS